MSMWFQKTHLLLHQASFQYPCFQHKLNTRQVIGITFAFEDQAKTKKNEVSMTHVVILCLGCSIKGMKNLLQHHSGVDIKRTIWFV